MDRFAIVTDSSADLTQAQMDAMHIDAFLPLSFSIDEQEYRSYPDERELTSEELYATLRNTKARVATDQPRRHPANPRPAAGRGTGCIVYRLLLGAERDLHLCPTDRR